MAMDPVGKEDKDINNDGKTNKVDTYLKARRSAIAKSIKKEEVELDEADESAQNLAIQAIQSKLKKAKVSYRDPNAKTAREEDRLAKQLAAKAKLKKEEVELDESMWEVSYDYGPHKSNTIKVKAKSQTHAWEVAKKVAKKEHGHDRITSGGVTPAKESVELEEGDYDDMVAAFKAKGGKITRVDYREPDEKQKAKLGASWTRGGGGKGGASQASGEYASMNKKDAAYNAKQATARKRALGIKEEAELEEGVMAWDSDTQTDRPVKHFEIHNTKTKSKVGTAKTMKAARTAKDKHDSNYGASVHSIKPVWEEVELDEGFKEKIGGIIRREKQKEYPLIQTRTDVAITKAGDAYAAGEHKKGDRYMKWRSKHVKEEVELSEGITKMSDARLKFHVLKKFPHGSYTNKELNDEHERRKRVVDNYHTVKPSLD